MATVEEIRERMLGYESRIAVLESLVVYVQTNFMSSQNAQAEMHFKREDQGIVSQEHIADTLGSMTGLIGEIQTEIDKLKNLSIAEPAKESAPVEAKSEKKTSAKGKKNEQPQSTSGD